MIPALALLLLLLQTAAAQESGLVASDVVALVNGTPILRKSLDDVTDATVSLSARKLDEPQRAQLRRDALRSLIELELLYTESQARGIKVSDAEVDAAIRRSRERFSSNEDFDQALRSKGLSRDQLRRDTAKTIAVDKLLESKVWHEAKVDSDDTREFYNTNQEQFSRPAQVRASHILIRVPADAGPEVRRRAHDKALQMLKELRAGREFAELARLNSEDPGTARSGGDLGYFARGEMLQEFEDQAFALERGEISEVFQTRLGFSILTVTDKRPAGIRPLAEVEAQIRNVLLKERREEKRRQMVAELRAKAKIEILDAELAAAE